MAACSVRKPSAYLCIPTTSSGDDFGLADKIPNSPAKFPCSTEIIPGLHINVYLGAHSQLQASRTFANKKPIPTGGHGVHPPSTYGKMHNESCDHSDKSHYAMQFITVYRGYTISLFFADDGNLKCVARCHLLRDGGRMAQARQKILCIEDDRETAALISEELIDCGFEVSTAYGGEEGLLAIMKATPDLVLCDISMPTMTGLEVLERLTEFAPRLGRIPFVFVTALANRDNELKGRRLGVNDYVAKPIDFERLVFIINARIAGVARTKLGPKSAKLSDREIEVLSLVARGKISVEIARKLHLSKRLMPGSNCARRRGPRRRLI